MDADAGRRRSGADIEPAHGRRVRAPGRAREELRQVADTGPDVAADVVRVVRFDVRRRCGRARQDAVAEAGGKAFDLRFDARKHIHLRPRGHVAVRPRGVLAGRRA